MDVNEAKMETLVSLMRTATYYKSMLWDIEAAIEVHIGSDLSNLDESIDWLAVGLDEPGCAFSEDSLSEEQLKTLISDLKGEED